MVLYYIIYLFMYTHMWWGMCVNMPKVVNRGVWGRCKKNEMINCNNGQIVWVEINLYIACYLLFIHIKKTLKPKWDQPGYSHLFVFFPIGHSQAQCIKDIVQSSFFPPGKPKETCTGQVISCSPPNLCIHFFRMILHLWTCYLFL